MPIQHEETRLLETRAERTVVPGASLGIGRVQVTEQVTGYQKKRFDRVLLTHTLSLPAFEFPTVGVWLQFTPEIARRVEAEGRDFFGAMHGVEHALIALAPLLAMCDPRDIGASPAGSSPTRAF